MSALRSVYDTSEIEKLEGVGYNPGHDMSLERVKKLASNKKYRLSKILKDLTKNRKLGCNSPKSLIPKRRFKKKMNVTNGQEVKNAANGNNNGVVFKPEPLTRNLSTADTTVSTLAWVN